ncbi:stromelysin-1-like [Schistocerca nitens]|uniref:stromelysin-1-like n=1 Tax=Schistocerca nitens TaxID=7011 RepID=UPI00211887C8|nr:stromelysin-1-like [Schistocerca nitens]
MIRPKLQCFNEALLIFQLTDKIEINGELSEDILNFMNIPRCDVVAAFGSYSISMYKWNKKNLNWHYKGANKKEVQETDAAFRLWQKYINILFNNDNGQDDVLGHAFSPNINNDPVEIHMDDKEMWYLIINADTPKIHMNLFEILVHEIGHSLGLRHTDLYRSRDVVLDN